MATLPKATVDALVDSGLLRLKLPAVLGGAEADPVTQMEVIEAIALIFAGGRVPTAAGVFMPGGEAVPVEGGYRVSGRWSFASGIRHAEWVGACSSAACAISTRAASTSW